MSNRDKRRDFIIFGNSSCLQQVPRHRTPNCFHLLAFTRKPYAESRWPKSQTALYSRSTLKCPLKQQHTRKYDTEIRFVIRWRSLYDDTGLIVIYSFYVRLCLRSDGKRWNMLPNTVDRQVNWERGRKKYLERYHAYRLGGALVSNESDDDGCTGIEVGR